MRAVGNYILHNRMQAITVLSLVTIIAMWLPQFAYPLSGVPVALVTLRRGGVPGMQVMLGSLLLTLLFTLLVQIKAPVTLIFALGIWLPVWFASMVLRTTSSQGMMVLSAGAIGILFLVVLQLALGDTSGLWKSWLDFWLEQSIPVNKQDEFRKLLESALPLMNAMLATSIVMSLVLTVLLGRWWQSRLFFPGEFRSEFQRLRIHHALSYPILVCVIALMVKDELQQTLLRDVLVIALFLYLFHGVAAVHRVVNSKGLSQAWLLAMYGLLILLLPQMVVFLVCLGIIDAWMGRKRSGADGKDQA